MQRLAKLLKFAIHHKVQTTVTTAALTALVVIASFMAYRNVTYYRSSTYNPFSESGPSFDKPPINSLDASDEDFISFFQKNPPRHAFISEPYELDSLTESLLRSGLPNSTEIEYRDVLYTAVSLRWFDAYCRWWSDSIQESYLAFVPEAFDCDNFADLFRSTTSITGLRISPQNEYQIGVANIIVLQKKSFAGIEGGPELWHSANIILTDSGWFVVEPQNGVYIALSSYPNLQSIKYIRF